MSSIICDGPTVALKTVMLKCHQGWDSVKLKAALRC